MIISQEQYTILHWLVLLVMYHKLRLPIPIMKRGMECLREHFLIDLEEYDAVVGYRADDSYFSFARAFLGNEILLQQLSYAMKLGKLGEQFVLKSQKAFEEIHFLSYEMADLKLYPTLHEAADWHWHKR